MQLIESSFEDHLDRFCSLDDTPVDFDERIRFFLLLGAHREQLETALWWSVSRLVHAELGPRDTYPTRLYVRSIGEVGKSSAAMASLFAHVHDVDGRGWETAREALVRVVAHWNDPFACERAAARLEALEEPFAVALGRLHAQLRGTRHKDALRRAQHWRTTTIKLLRTLASPCGALRLLHEYLHGVREQFHQSCVHDVGAYELFVLEVVNFISQAWKLEAAPSAPRPLEQQGPRRRKRIERARFRLLCRWELDSDIDWTTLHLPTLRCLARCH